jgi:plastocyanin
MTLAASTVILTNNYVGKTYGQPETNFPPPIFDTLRSEPSYVIDIPYSPTGLSTYDPSETSIPTGFTVIWFNDDEGDHSVTTTASNETYTAPESFDSGPIETDGGSFIHTFDKPGIYHYYDTFDPSAKGTINVGSAVEEGKNMNMLIGGSALPFNASEPQRVVLSFVPKTVTFPPVIALTYNVSLLNASTGKMLYSHNYDDSDGILDLELVPSHAGKNASHFDTWGPDFIGQEAVNSDGTFHIKGPVLIENSPYPIDVQITAKDNKEISPPLGDQFILPNS